MNVSSSTLAVAAKILSLLSYGFLFAGAASGFRLLDGNTSPSDQAACVIGFALGIALRVLGLICQTAARAK